MFALLPAKKMSTKYRYGTENILHYYRERKMIKSYKKVDGSLEYVHRYRII